MDHRTHFAVSLICIYFFYFSSTCEVNKYLYQLHFTSPEQMNDFVDKIHDTTSDEKRILFLL